MTQESGVSGREEMAAEETKGLKSETSSAWPIPRTGKEKRATNSFLEARFPIRNVTRESKCKQFFISL